MLSEKDHAAAGELRLRAERHRLMARQISDQRAAQALHAVADKEARQAVEIEQRQDNAPHATDLDWVARQFDGGNERPY